MMELSLEFIEQRIREQKDYLMEISLIHDILGPDRILEISHSALGQLRYFERKKIDHDYLKVKTAYAQEFENIMKASTNIIH